MLKNTYFSKEELTNKSENIVSHSTFIYLTIILFIHHISLLLLTSYSKNLSFAKIFSNWDSEWYMRIINEGYNLKSIAFYPLYPIIIKIISHLFHNIPIQFIGTGVSTLFFIIFCFLVYKLSNTKEKNSNWLLPQTTFGYLLFIYSPSSFIFHTNHTESLFLLLSFLALYSANKNWIIASILAGLSTLTKNQGVILAISISFMCASNAENKCDKIKIFILSSLISISFFSTFLIAQYIYFSTPFAFINAQSNWSHISSIQDYFKVFFEIFQYKELTRFRIYEAIYFLFLIAGCFLLFKKSKAVFFYAFASLLLLPLQGSLMNTFRYSIFIFPLIFTLGDFIYKKNKLFSILFIFFLFYLNHQMTRNYYLERWCY